MSSNHYSPHLDLNQLLQSFVKRHPSYIDIGLGRVVAALDALGNPEALLPPVIHIAGTNGKGSTVATVRALLVALGLRIHAYTSPHLVCFTERISLYGKPISPETCMEILQDLDKSLGEMAITFFESTTLAAFMAFVQNPTDAVILEVGMGGRLDATNVVTPALSAVTRIGFDHQAFLGNTIPLIAREKAGIFKAGVPAVIAYQSEPEAMETLVQAALEVGAVPYAYGRDWGCEAMGDGQIHYTSGTADWLLPRSNLVGKHQIENTGTALALLDLWLQRQGMVYDDLQQKLSSGLQNVRWAGRLQRLEESEAVEAVRSAITENTDIWPEIWLDGAHNPAGAKVLAQWLKTDGRKWHILMGMKDNKDYQDCLAKIVPYAASFTAVPVDGIASADPFALAHCSETLGCDTVKVESSVLDGLIRIINLKDARKNDKEVRNTPILVTGSLHLVGYCLRIL